MEPSQIVSTLIRDARHLIEHPDPGFPIQIFHCREKQSLHQVHFFQPTLMLVLRGTKQISTPNPLDCEAGSLILVSAGHEFPFANIPNEFYMALTMGFLPEDFDASDLHLDLEEKIKVETAPPQVLLSMQQLMSLVHHDMGSEFLGSRRKEIAQLLKTLGLDTLLRMPKQASWQTKVMQLIQSDIAYDWQLKEVCQRLNTSESNLRRNLLSEGLGYRELLEDLRLTNGLGMIQTTHLPITQIALECGYQSSSRFSERFKKRFHCSPSELRKAH